MYRPNKWCQLAVLGLATTFAACKSTSSDSGVPAGDDKLVVTDDQGNQKVVIEWWNNPGDVGKFAAAGAAKVHGNVNAARNRAEVQGRATLAASLKAEIQSLSELWSQEAGDNLNEESVSSMFNDETFIRQIVDTTLLGARVDRYKQVDGNMYALIILEKPETFINNIVDEGKDKIKEDTLLETQVRKEMAAEKLDNLLGQKTAEYAEETAKMQANLQAIDKQ